MIGDQVDKFYAAVAGGIVMLLLTPAIHPLSKRLEALSRRIYKIKPVSIHVERDPSVIYAGFPRWVGSSVWLPELPDSAPDDPTDWNSWAQGLGGADAYLTVLKITITSRQIATVVVNPPKVRRDSLPIGTPPKGLVATSPVGGAEMDPRRIQINLEMGTAIWVNPDGRPIEARSVTLSSGDVEQFYVYVMAEIGRYSWHLELPVLIDGHREIIRITDGERPFITYGMDGFTEYLWHDDSWKARDSL